MKFVALKELPQGQQPGDVFDTTEDIGRVLVSVGAARLAEDKDATTAKRRYTRRDLTAET